MFSTFHRKVVLCVALRNYTIKFYLFFFISNTVLKLSCKSLDAVDGMIKSNQFGLESYCQNTQIVNT